MDCERSDRRFRYCSFWHIFASYYLINDTDQDRPEKACSVGKQFEAGGLENYDKSGSRGVQFGLNYFFKHKNTLDEFGFQTGLENKTFILQVIVLSSYILQERIISR